MEGEGWKGAVLEDHCKPYQSIYVELDGALKAGWYMYETLLSYIIHYLLYCGYLYKYSSLSRLAYFELPLISK